MAPKKTQPTLAPAPPAAPAIAANDLLLQKRDALVTALQQLSNSALQVSWATNEYFNLQYPGLAQGLQGATGLIAQRAASLAIDAAHADEPSGKRQKKKEKKLKDPDEPKRPVTAYFLFLANARPQLQKDMKDASPKEIQIEAVNKWYAMTDAEKQPYKDLYEANYAKWKTDMEEYKAKKRAEGGLAEDGDTTAGFTAVNNAANQIASAAAAAAVAAVETVEPDTEKKGGRAKSTPKKAAKETKEKSTGRASERKKKDSAKEAANKEAETPSKKDDGKRKRKRGKA